ncbi:MAG TPA: CRTAC1 family protein [Phycisphaerales bacterium]|nr:CRTAC1 family protein [Phycisphaerales bacterium]
MGRSCILVVSCAGAAWGQLSFVDATSDLGLGGLSSPHCCFADLNNDGRPDAVIGRNRVYLNVADETSPRKLRFVEVAQPGLPAFRGGDISVFADLDNDGNKDCIWTRYLDVNADNYEPPTDGPPKTAWLRGNGDGTFGDPLCAWEVIEPAKEATTAAIALGDVDSDGWLDIYLGNWYRKYGGDLEGIPNALLRNHLAGAAGANWSKDQSFPHDAEPFNEESDPGGRPTYGVMILRFIADDLHPSADGMLGLLDLNYGRRWNRLWIANTHRPNSRGQYEWLDVAPELGLDGDPIRHGRYPDWLQERAKTDPRFAREDEKPFRANGNTFDAAVGDIDSDGDFDLFFAEITHAWAGESSDRSRFLVQQRGPDGAITFTSPPELSVDRIPADPTIRSWNQGDLYCELADLDLDGRLDLVLCSSDYPDNQRLRIYRQQEDGAFSDITPWIGLDHVGAQQPSLADIDADGDLDLIVGQSFNRMRPDQTEGRTPRVRLFLNEASDKALGNALVLRLTGDESRGVSRDALGAVVRCTATIRGERITQSRQLIGIGGHQGKQMDFAIHFGLADATVAERVEIEWPSRERTVTVLENLSPGTHRVDLARTAIDE